MHSLVPLLTRSFAHSYERASEWANDRSYEVTDRLTTINNQLIDNDCSDNDNGDDNANIWNNITDNTDHSYNTKGNRVEYQITIFNMSWAERILKVQRVDDINEIRLIF